MIENQIKAVHIQHFYWYTNIKVTLTLSTSKSIDKNTIYKKEKKKQKQNVKFISLQDWYSKEKQQ
jgi:hypothetical protein